MKTRPTLTTCGTWDGTPFASGAQPRDEDALDPGFLELLHDVLDLTDANEIHVLLDNHGDMVGSAGKSMLCDNNAARSA